MSFLSTYKDFTDKALKEFFEKEIEQEPAELMKEILGAIKEFTLRGGKRIRAALTIIGYGGAVKDANINKVKPLCLAVELLQGFFLIHDDIIDQADLRRGKKTLHRIFEIHGSGEDFGKSMAILAGNLSFIKGQKILQDTPEINGKIKYALLTKFNELADVTHHGQLLDMMLGERKLSEISEEDIFKVLELKTANYTLAGPLQLGMLLGNASYELIQQVSEIALPLGIAFQLVDDYLGLFGEEAKTGKPVISDILEGKKTLLVWTAYNKGDEYQRNIIRLCLGNPNITWNEIELIRNIVRETGALDEIQERIKRAISESKAKIKQLDLFEPYKSYLLELADFISSREV